MLPFVLCTDNIFGLSGQERRHFYSQPEIFWYKYVCIRKEDHSLVFSTERNIARKVIEYSCAVIVLKAIMASCIDLPPPLTPGKYMDQPTTPEKRVTQDEYLEYAIESYFRSAPKQAPITPGKALFRTPVKSPQRQVTKERLYTAPFPQSVTVKAEAVKPQKLKPQRLALLIDPKPLSKHTKGRKLLASGMKVEPVRAVVKTSVRELLKAQMSVMPKKSPAKPRPMPLMKSLPKKKATVTKIRPWVKPVPMEPKPQVDELELEWDSPCKELMEELFGKDCADDSCFP